ncbi:MAG: flagellar motor switch protein FliN [Salinispira sp.]
MSDGSLSQEEIDALLQGAGGVEVAEPAPPPPSDLSDSQFQEFSSIVRGATEEMSASLALLLGKSVTLGQPQIDQVNGEMIAANLGDEILNVVLDFNSGDEHGFLMEPKLAMSIASSIQGMEGVELDEASINALQEGIQSMFTPLLTAISEKSGESFITNLPSGGIRSKNDLNFHGKFVRLIYSLGIDGSGIGTIIEYFSAGAIAAMVVNTLAPAQSAMNPASANPAHTIPIQGNRTMNNGAMKQQPAGAAGAGVATGAGVAMGAAAPSAVIQGVQFPNLSGGINTGEQTNIGLLMDVSMEMTVELGRTKKLIKDILGMGEGTIIELDKLAGEPVDILVNHKLIAKGEVVVIDENFGVRVTEIVSPMERMNTIS